MIVETTEVQFVYTSIRMVVSTCDEPLGTTPAAEVVGEGVVWLDLL